MKYDVSSSLFDLRFCLPHLLLRNPSLSLPHEPPAFLGVIAPDLKRLSGSEKVLPAWGQPLRALPQTHSFLTALSACCSKSLQQSGSIQSFAGGKKRLLRSLKEEEEGKKAQAFGSCPWAVNSQGLSHRSPGIAVGNPHSTGEQCRVIRVISEAFPPPPQNQLWHFEKKN